MTSSSKALRRAAPRPPPAAPPPRASLEARSRCRDHLVPALLVLAVGVACYVGALHGPFVFDDLPELADNPAIREVGGWLPGGPAFGTHPTRWVAYLSFALSYRAGGLDPAAFRVANVVIHLATALLVYALALATLRTPRLRGSAIADPPLARAVATAAALLFVAHPLQTQAVTYVVQRITSLAAFFYVLAAVQYARWRIARLEGRGRTAGAALHYAGALGAAVLAMYTKEIAFTLPFAIVLWELAFLGRPDRWTAAALAPLAATALIIPFTMIGPAHPTDALSAAAAITSQTELSRLDYLRSELPVVVEYLRLLLVPIGQNVDPEVAVHRSFLEPAVLGSALLLVALLAGASLVVLRARRRADGPGLDPAACVAGFGVLWLFVTLSVESSVVPIGDLMFEHRVYLPSVGFFLAVAAAGGWAAARLAPHAAGARRSLLAGTLVVAAVLALATIARNRVWRDEASLWTDAAEKSPGKPRPHLNAGQALIAQGDVDGAIAQYVRALQADPEYAEAHNNLGVAYFQKGLVDLAISHLRMAIALDPGYAEAHNNLGIAYGRKGWFDLARQEIEAGMRLPKERR